jgi:AcrR family transcriptional regulator
VTDGLNLQLKANAPRSGRVRVRRHSRPAESQERLTRKAQRSLATRERILDCAEELFSRHGLYGVTVRNVSQRAGVDTALIHYYFGTKRELFDAVFARGAEAINGVRLVAMADYERANPGGITIEGAIRAFLQPVIANDRKGEQSWRNFSALVALANNSKEWGGEMMSRHFDVVIHALIALLRKALPDAADEDLYWAYQMFTGSLMVLHAATGRLELLSGGLCRSGDVDAFEERLVQYATAGFEAICRRDEAARGR